MRFFPDDAACAAYLEKVRWPDCFVCHHCQWHGNPCRFPNRSSVVLRCRSCKRDTSLTAGTVMQRTHTPISIWFWAAYLVSSQTPGMSAMQFQRQLGLSRYETAFQILHKLRVAMVRPDRDRIGGKFSVEVDETWVGGRTRGEGRGRHHKTLVVGAIEERKRKEDEEERDHRKALPRRGGLYAGRLRLCIVPDRSAKSLENFVAEAVQPGTRITTDDWSGYDRLAEKGYWLLVAGFGMICRSPMMTGSCCVGWCQLHDRFAATRAYVSGFGNPHKYGCETAHSQCALESLNLSGRPIGMTGSTAHQ